MAGRRRSHAEEFRADAPAGRDVARTATDDCNGQADYIEGAFIEDELDAPKHLARRVDEWYFVPEHEDFQPRTIWSLSNAVTSAFKELDPMPQFKATAKLGSYLERVARSLIGVVRGLR